MVRDARERECVHIFSTDGGSIMNEHDVRCWDVVIVEGCLIETRALLGPVTLVSRTSRISLNYNYPYAFPFAIPLPPPPT